MYRRKKTYYPSFLIPFIFLCSVPLHSQGFSEIVKDSMNFAILVSNYETYEFEMGHFSTNELCSDCDSGGLPLEMIFEVPIDFGNITFRYTENFDTLFFAEIVWLGLGNIIFPNNFLPADSFLTTANFPNDPISIEYINIIEMDSITYRNKADSALDMLKSLRIVNEFSDYLYRIGIYLYTPSVGGIDWSVAKWIVFLYVGNFEVNSIPSVPFLPDKFRLYQNYPNPFNPSTIIGYELPNSSIVTLKIYNILGREISTLLNEEKPAGRYEVEFDGTGLPGGIYFYQIKAGNHMLTKKSVLMK